MFRVKLGGPNDDHFALGICGDGMYHVIDPDHRGSYESANMAVRAIRKKVCGVEHNNAFLYVEIEIDGLWHSADHLRKSLKYRYDVTADEAFWFGHIRDLIKATAKRKKVKLSSNEVWVKTLQYIGKHPEHAYPPEK